MNVAPESAGVRAIAALEKSSKKLVRLKASVFDLCRRHTFGVLNFGKIISVFLVGGNSIEREAESCGSAKYVSSSGASSNHRGSKFDDAPVTARLIRQLDTRVRCACASF